MNGLVYLYGFVPADGPAPPPLEGVGGGTVECFAVAGFAAVISTVPAEEFAADRLDARLAQLDWVAAQGLAHERVVAWFVDHADIAPAPLFTLYSSKAALRAAASAERERIAGQLEHARGRREWGLRVAHDAAVLRAGIDAASDAVRALDAEIAAAAPGRRFLLARKRDALVREEMCRIVHGRADALLQTLSGHAEDVLRLPLPRADAATVLHAALLVRTDAAEPLQHAFATGAARLEPLGMVATLSGPWAPYRFLGGAG